jgi:hypothetical protein
VQPTLAFSRGTSHVGLSALDIETSAAYAPRAAAPTVADSLDYLLSVVAYGAEEYPPLQAVEAVSLLVALLVLVGGGLLRALR